MWRLIIPDFSQKIFRCTISELTLPCNISYLKDLLKTTFIPVLIGYDCLFPYLYRALRLFNFLIIVLFLGISLKKVEQKADQSQSAGGPSFFSNIPPPLNFILLLSLSPEFIHLTLLLCPHLPLSSLPHSSLFINSGIRPFLHYL